MEFEILGAITQIATIVEGTGIRELAGLRDRYGNGHWRKKKGIATVRLPDRTTATAEVHWYEAHGIGRVKLKIKAWL